MAEPLITLPEDLLDPATPVTVTNCDREPIHLPGAIQPHGVLLTWDPTTEKITVRSANAAEWFATPPQVGQPLRAWLGAAQADRLAEVAGASSRPQSLKLTIADRTYLATTYDASGLHILELEPFDATATETALLQLNNCVAQLREATDLSALFRRSVRLMRDLTGFDRVMIYRFADSGDGEVVAEAANEGMEPYLGLRYPATDIPQQARALYVRNPIRSIVDVDYRPVPLEPATSLDLSFSTLRSVSPIHIEYLKNMGVTASMSVSIIYQNKLWGLFACHHRTPHRVPAAVRDAAELLAQNFVFLLQERLSQAEAAFEVRLRDTLYELFQRMANSNNFVEIIDPAGGGKSLLDVVPAAGVAVLFDGEVQTQGQTPPPEALRALTAWLSNAAHPDVYYTSALPQAWPEGAPYADVASGLLAVTLSQVQGDYVCWFRPEVVKEVRWAGQPRKNERLVDGERFLSPRQSFQAWQQNVQGTATPWQPLEIRAAESLRSHLIDVVLKVSGELKLRADILERLNRELEQSNDDLDSFAYIASHDLKEPLRGIHNYANFLLEDYHDKLGPDGLRQLRTLTRLSQRMEHLIESLLHFSRAGRTKLSFHVTNLDKVVYETIDLYTPRLEQVGGSISLSGRFPTLPCDRVRIGEVFNNFIANAIKYARPDVPPQIEVGYLAPTEDLPSSTPPELSPGEHVFYVRDNGIGIPKKHHASIFRMFKRLHGRDEYGGGTGAGLAIVRKVIDRHNGHIWLESEEGRGTVFYFSIGTPS